jgi:hypothetical protein
MSSIPTFEFRLRDAPQRAVGKAFADLCISTKRFARNERGAVVWSPSPNDWIPIARAAEFRTVLEDGEILRITGDVGRGDDTDVYFTLWTMLNDRRWLLPRLNPSKPYEPPAPLGVAHVAPQDRYRRGRDVA